jgi:hypothetical protein
MNRRELEQAAISAADRCLKTTGYVSTVDVLMELGNLSREDYERWRFRKVPFLERVIQGNLAKINTVLRAVQSNAARGKMKASWTAYTSWGKGKREPLRFSKSGDPNVERAYATHYLLPRAAPATSQGLAPAYAGDHTSHALSAAETGQAPVRAPCL